MSSSKKYRYPDAPSITDYQFTNDAADSLAGLMGMPHAARVELMPRILGVSTLPELAEIFSQFIGLINSVEENIAERVEEDRLKLGAKPEEAGRLNMPSVRGALFGLKTARTAGCDAKPCGTCAFRLGTVANQCFETLLAAEDCIRDREDDFLCHEHPDEQGDPTRTCAAFAAATGQPVRKLEPQE